jgi:SAM-dependent methyltransferase
VTDVYERIVEHLRAHAATKVFDIGCGTGELGIRLRNNGFFGPYKGLDRDAKAIEALHNNGFAGDEGDLCWYDGNKFAWDTVVCKDMLEELEALSLLSDAILMARRVFILATQATLYDSLSPAPTDAISFNIDDILGIARTCNFQLHHFEQIETHNLIVFTRRRKRK